MTLEQFEEYMNEVEKYAAGRTEGDAIPFLCWCFNLQTGSNYNTATKTMIERLRPDNTNHTAWMDEGSRSPTKEEQIDYRMTALFLFEQICISEKLYLEF